MCKIYIPRINYCLFLAKFLLSFFHYFSIVRFQLSIFQLSLKIRVITHRIDITHDRQITKFILSITLNHVRPLLAQPFHCLKNVNVGLGFDPLNTVCHR